MDCWADYMQSLQVDVTRETPDEYVCKWQVGDGPVLGAGYVRILCGLFAKWFDLRLFQLIWEYSILKREVAQNDAVLVRWWLEMCEQPCGYRVQIAGNVVSSVWSSRTRLSALHCVWCCCSKCTNFGDICLCRPGSVIRSAI